MKRFWELVMSSRGADRVYCLPFALLFRLMTPLYQFFSRRQLESRHKACSGGWQARVISVGNITVGGSGKTPIVIYLAQQFLSGGKKVAIVHSGYGRMKKNDLLFNSAKGREYPIDRIGDEVAMMAQMLPNVAFAVGRDKKTMVTMVDREHKPDVILIDDGYQRLDIKKDLDIAVVGAELLIHDTSVWKRLLHLFPGGILREPMSALARADALFLAGSAPDLSLIKDIAMLRTYNSRAAMVSWQLGVTEVECDGNNLPVKTLRERRPYLFAGIGSYARLKNMIKDLDLNLAGDYDFGDHFDYDRSDFEMLKRLSDGTGADCYLTTAKDRVKLPGSGLDKPLYCLLLRAQPTDRHVVDGLLGLDLS